MRFLFRGDARRRELNDVRERIGRTRAEVERLEKTADEPHAEAGEAYRSVQQVRASMARQELATRRAELAELLEREAALEAAIAQPVPAAAPRADQPAPEPLQEVSLEQPPPEMPPSDRAAVEPPAEEAVQEPVPAVPEPAAEMAAVEVSGGPTPEEAPGAAEPAGATPGPQIEQPALEAQPIPAAPAAARPLRVAALGVTVVVAVVALGLLGLFFAAITAPGPGVSVSPQPTEPIAFVAATQVPSTPTPVPPTPLPASPTPAPSVLLTPAPPEPSPVEEEPTPEAELEPIEPAIILATILAPAGFNGVVLRATPGVNARTLSFLLNGARVEILDGSAVADGFRWVRARTADGTVGWMVSVGVGR